MRILTIMLAAALATAATAQPPAPDPSLEIYAKPQLLVPLAGGRKLHIYCMGQGSPTVILSAGQGGWSGSWAKVQPAIAERTRICAWDRAGYGFSDGSPLPQTAVNTTSDLIKGLKAARIGGPYVLVGHSAGSYETLLFADRHKKDVVGMVLVDPSIPGQAERFAAASPKGMEAVRQSDARDQDGLRRCAAQLRTAAMPAEDEEKCFSYFPDTPPALKAALRERDHDPSRLLTQASLSAQFNANSALVVKARRNYGAMPLIVLTAANLALPSEAKADADAVQTIWREGHDALAALSSRGVNRIVEGSGHNIHRERPEAVIDAINQVLDAAR